MNPIFRTKKFDEQNLGSYLRAGRKKEVLSLEQVAEKVGVSRRHLKALEENDFQKLPPEIYVKGFIAGYCELLELDKNKAFHLFEKVKLTPKKDNPSRAIFAHAWFGRVFSYRHFAILLALLFLATSVFYISKAIYPMYAQPSFQLTYPAVCPFSTGEDKIELKGVIQPEGKIWVNEEETIVDKDGNFTCPLFLKAGENPVKFRIQNKFGRERRADCQIFKN
jgi:transcriptional regulator with XRE-family HTH domain